MVDEPEPEIVPEPIVEATPEEPEKTPEPEIEKTPEPEKVITPIEVTPRREEVISISPTEDDTDVMSMIDKLEEKKVHYTLYIY